MAYLGKVLKVYTAIHTNPDMEQQRIMGLQERVVATIPASSPSLQPAPASGSEKSSAGGPGVLWNHLKARI